MISPVAFIIPTHMMLLWGGGLIASPIIIHLLNKRRFNVVEWAAMEFLLNAERTNRRRINLEHLILLLLRCLLVLLITLLVARPLFDPSGFGGAIVPKGNTERILLIDNSPSLGVRQETQTVFETTQKRLTKFVRELARERPGDSVTIITTSRPNRPYVRGKFVNGNGAEELVRQIKGLELASRTASFDRAIPALMKLLENAEANETRVLYIVSDFRHVDWLANPKPDPKRGLPALMKKLRDEKLVQGMHLVSVLNDAVENLTITRITPPKRPLVEGIPASFKVTVRNGGTADVDQVPVRFTVGDGFPLRGMIPTIPPGEEKTIPFSVNFQESGSLALRAEIGSDTLPADNTVYFPAQVKAGLGVLLVDGEPDASVSRSESFFLKRALSPPGELRSGYRVEVIDDMTFEDRALAPFSCIFLANVHRLSEARILSLAKWVRKGGGLAIALGDQIDADFYSTTLTQTAPELFPLRDLTLAGDEQEMTWVNFAGLSPNHPVLRVFSGERNPFLSRIKVFRWWASTIDEKALQDDSVRVIASWSGTDNNPALVEKSVGDGRVMILTTPLDAEWGTWPSDPSFVVTLQEMVRYLARPPTNPGLISVGAPIHHRFNPGVYKLQARVTPVGEAEAMSLQAGATKRDDAMQFVYEDTDAVGFYALELEKRDGTIDKILYAANLDPNEGDLRGAAEKDLRTRLALGSDVSFITGDISVGISIKGAKIELWRWVLLALVLVLCAEQFVAWLFGQRRT